MSFLFLMQNLNTISRRNKEKLASEGYLDMTTLFDSTGHARKHEFSITLKGQILLGLVEEKSTHLKFCKACGKGHWRKGKQFCADECKTNKNEEKKKKELDFEAVMKEIRAKKQAKKDALKPYQRKYYAENREKILDYCKDYQHKKRQEQIQLTILTTTI